MVPTAGREAAVAAVAVVVLGLVSGGFSLGFAWSNLHNALLAVSFAAVGLYVLRARPRHLIGGLFVVAGVQSAVMFFGRQYGLHEPALPASDWLAWLSIWQVPLEMALVGTALLTFPSGRLLSPAWRWPLGAMLGLCGLLALASALWPIEDDWRHGDIEFPFVLGDPEAARAVLVPVQLTCYQSFLLLWVVAVVVRARRAGDDETRQLRWLVSAVTLMAVVLVVGTVVAGTVVPGLLAASLIPLAAGVAVVKHRLYDIDPVIDRTIVVGALAVLVTAGYVVLVVGVGQLLPVPEGVLSVVATAVVAVAFEPVRRRAQQLATRLVHGRRATPYEALAALSERVEDSPDDLLAGVAATVANAVGAEQVVVWAGAEDRLRAVAAWHPRRAARAPGAGHAVPRGPAGGGGARRGVGAQAGRSPADRRRGAAARRPRRPGRAGDRPAGEGRGAARRRPPRGHRAGRGAAPDRARPARRRPAAPARPGGRARRHRPANVVGRRRPRPGAARDRLLEATAELRVLARGLHPQVLAQDGLAAALASLADTAPLPVRLDLRLPDRLPAEVEATAYFLASEAVTNAARHSGAGVVCLTARRTRGGLEVEVADDGVGGADASRGSGLQGLADRLAVLGARLVVSSPTDGGTRVRAVIPCA